MSKVPPQTDCTDFRAGGRVSSILAKHSLTRLPTAQAGPTGPVPTAAGNDALIIEYSSTTMSKQRIKPPAAQGMSPARTGSNVDMMPARTPEYGQLIMPV